MSSKRREPNRTATRKTSAPGAARVRDAVGTPWQRLMALIESVSNIGSSETVARDFAMARLDRLSLDRPTLDAVRQLVDAAEDWASVDGVKAFADVVEREVLGMLESESPGAAPESEQELVTEVRVPASVAQLVERLELQTSRIELAHQARDGLVAQARRERVPWDEIARATGLTSEGARKRWGRRPGKAS